MPPDGHREGGDSVERCCDTQLSCQGRFVAEWRENGVDAGTLPSLVGNHDNLHVTIDICPRA